MIAKINKMNGVLITIPGLPHLAAPYRTIPLIGTLSIHGCPMHPQPRRHEASKGLA
jgi:hypothetical protein